MKNHIPFILTEKKMQDIAGHLSEELKADFVLLVDNGEGEDGFCISNTNNINKTIIMLEDTAKELNEIKDNNNPSLLN